MAAKKRRKRGRSRRAKRGTHASAKCLGGMRYRSSWELAYALWMDGNPGVESYRYEPYGIPYVSNLRTGRIRTYWPDFEVILADGTKALVEVKPAKKVDRRINVKKRDAALIWCRDRGMTYQLVTEIELKALGSLTR